QAQQARWRRGVGQLRDREGAGAALHPPRRERADRHDRSDWVRRTRPRPGCTGAGPRRVPAAPPDRRGRARPAGVAAVDGSARPAPDAPVPARVGFLRRRLVVAVVLGLPVLLLSLVPPLQFDGWQWVALVLATPVATWAAWPFHRAMALNLRHGQSTMDTLISV